MTILESCFSHFNLIASSPKDLWMIAADWLEDKGEISLAASFRNSIYKIVSMCNVDNNKDVLVSLFYPDVFKGNFRLEIFVSDSLMGRNPQDFLEAYDGLGDGYGNGFGGGMSDFFDGYDEWCQYSTMGFGRGCGQGDGGGTGGVGYGYADGFLGYDD